MSALSNRQIKIWMFNLHCTSMLNCKWLLPRVYVFFSKVLMLAQKKNNNPFSMNSLFKTILILSKFQLLHKKNRILFPLSSKITHIVSLKMIHLIWTITSFYKITAYNPVMKKIIVDTCLFDFKHHYLIIPRKKHTCSFKDNKIGCSSEKSCAITAVK